MSVVVDCTCGQTGVCTRCVLNAFDRDPGLDWRQMQEYGAHSMAADLIRDHVALMRAGGETSVFVLDDYRRTR